MREQLIQAGIKNLKEFGYPSVNEENILTDMIYSAFFKQMLEETIDTVQVPAVVEAAESLMKEIVQE
jgi:hypothetical protein